MMERKILNPLKMSACNVVEEDSGGGEVNHKCRGSDGDHSQFT